MTSICYTMMCCEYTCNLLSVMQTIFKLLSRLIELCQRKYIVPGLFDRRTCWQNKCFMSDIHSEGVQDSPKTVRSYNFSHFLLIYCITLTVMTPQINENSTSYSTTCSSWRQRDIKTPFYCQFVKGIYRSPVCWWSTLQWLVILHKTDFFPSEYHLSCWQRICHLIMNW